MRQRLERLADHLLATLLIGRKDNVAYFAVRALHETARIHLVQSDGLAIGVVALRLRGRGFTCGDQADKIRGRILGRSQGGKRQT